MADRYWVGGTGNWSDTTKWSTTSGGAGGSSVPTSSDSVFFDSASHTGAYTITINSSARSCLDFNMGAPASGKVTWAGTIPLNIYGNLNLSGGTAGITRTFSGTLSFLASSGTKTISTNGVQLNSATTFFGLGAWELSDDYYNAGKNITLTKGSFNSNGYTVTCAQFSSSSTDTRTLTMGASTWNLSASLIMSVTTNLTFNSNTSNINILGTGGIAFNGGGLSFYNVTLDSSVVFGNSTINGANTFNNLTLNSSAPNIMYSLSDNQTINNVLTITGTATNRLFLYSDVIGTQRTISAATTTISYVDFQDIIGTGGGSWSGTSIGDADNNTGITFTTPVTRYWIGGTGNWNDINEWATTSGGAGGASMPIVHDTAIFDSNSFSAVGQSVTINVVARIGTINFTGVSTDNPTVFTNNSLSFYNNFTLSSGMNISGSAAVIYSGRRNTSITTNSANFSNSGGFTVNCMSGTLTLNSNLQAVNMVLTSGTLTLNNFNLYTLTFTSTGNLTRVLNCGSGTIEIQATSTPWNWSGLNFTFNCNTSTLKFNNTAASLTALNFVGASLIYYNVWFSRSGSTASLTISGSNTFNQLKDTGTAAHSLLFTVGTTQTIADWQVSGNPGALITINSTTTGTHTLTKTSGTVTADYLNIQHSIATGGATWNAGANSVNNQSVSTAGSGWIFPSLSNGNMFLMFY